MSKRIMVTGGAGFIGSNFVHHCLANDPDCEVVVVDALTYAGSIENISLDASGAFDPRVEFWYGNVCNEQLINSLVETVDYVVHFAAETHVTRSIFDNRQFFETDVIGTQTVANAVLKNPNRRVRKFIHISSSEVYGTAKAAEMDEDHPLDPMSPYAAAKCGADRLAYSYWTTYKLPVVIMRPFNNFGPRQHLEKAIPRFITSVMLNEEITVHGTGGAQRDYVYVKDVCRAIDAVIAAPDEAVVGEVFNVATGDDRSIIDIASQIVEIMDYDRSRIIFQGDRPGQVERHCGASSKIRERLGWQPETDWDTGLRETIDWYRNNRDVWHKQVWCRSVPIVTASGKVERH